MIPPGLHFIYYSAVSTFDSCSTGPRSGFFHFFQPKEMLIKAWDVKNEELFRDDVSDEEQRMFQDNLMGDLDKFLGPYDYDLEKRWSGLTDYITPHVLQRLNPTSGFINSVTQLIPQPFISSASHKMSLDRQPSSSSDTRDSISKKGELRIQKLDQLLPEMEIEPSACIKFTKINLKYPCGSSSSQITKHSLDSSFLLEKLADEWNGSLDSVLGEVQFSFVAFLVGQVYDGFEQWKQLLKIISSCDDALEKCPQFFRDLIRVLHFQIQEVPIDFFVEIVAHENFLIVILRNFFYNIESNSVEDDLKRRAGRFRQSLEHKFKWSFEIESDCDDERPVIVEDVSIDA